MGEMVTACPLEMQQICFKWLLNNFKCQESYNSDTIEMKHKKK